MAKRKALAVTKFDPNGFDLVHADPPWQYDDKSKNRGGAERWYSTMSIDELKQINVGDYCKKDAYLFMWTTFPLLEESFDVLRAWGFNYSTAGFIWVKRSKNHWQNVALRLRRALRAKFAGQKVVKISEVMSFLKAEEVKAASKDRWFWGMGSHTRANAEIVLIGIRGKPKRASKGIHQVLEELVGAHSVKPDEVYARLNEFIGADAIKFDMFTRQNREGYLSLGDQVGKTDFIIDAETYQLVDVRPKELLESQKETASEQPTANRTGLKRLVSACISAVSG